MKRKFAGLLSIILFSLILVSCEEDFNPKGEIKNLYVLNCTVAMYNNISASVPTPSASVKAVITTTYDVDGFIPEKPESSLFVPKVSLSFFQSLKEFKLRDSSVIHQKSGDLISRYKYYSFSSQVPSLLGNDQCRITARMPDGKVLSAATVTPRPVFFDLSRAFNHGITADVNKFYAGNELIFSWGDPVKSSHLFFPKFVINARIISLDKPLKIEIPLKYIKRSDKYEPVLPGATNLPYAAFEYDAIDSAMKSITGGIYEPGNILVENCTMTVTEYDNNLSAYYSSTNGYMDSYSIRLDENVYSNINGGIGVFGSYMVNTETYPMDKEYVRSFGYKSAYDVL